MRLFIASRLDRAAASRLEESMREVRKHAARASWVKNDAYHLTYAFLGEQDEKVASQIGERLPAIAEPLAPYRGKLSGGGFFPNDRRPRVGWVAFVAPEPLVDIATTVRNMLDDARIDFDRKAFRPHLTLVRIRDGWNRRDVADFQHACEKTNGLEVTIDRVSLFRSELSPAGARHQELVGVDLEADLSR